MWIDGNTCMHAQTFYLLYVAVKVPACFYVNSKIISAGFFKCFCIFFRIFYHQVYITIFGCSV